MKALNSRYKRHFTNKSFVLAFIVGLLFALLIFFLTFNFWDKWSFVVVSKFNVTPKELGELFVNSMLYARFYLVFVILAPAIALHWLVKSFK